MHILSIVIGAVVALATESVLAEEAQKDTPKPPKKRKTKKLAKSVPIPDNSGVPQNRTDFLNEPNDQNDSNNDSSGIDPEAT